MLWLHVIAGLLSLLAGFTALYSTKGSPLHKRAGRVFAAAMAVMAASALFIAVVQRPNMINVIAATLTLYLVCTGVLAVARPVERVRALLFGLMLVALATSATGLVLGNVAAAAPRGMVDGIPAAVYFMFGSVAGIGALLDARLLWTGQLPGKHRVARHLWRMGYAMWIATMSFFLGQSDEFPAAVRASGVQFIPVAAVSLTLLYWVVRALFARSPLTLNPHAAQSRRSAETAVPAYSPGDRLPTR
jgi:uncharacterized membrane protein